MSNWGVVTWIGVIILALVLLIYYVGAASNLNAGASAFGSTVKALTGGGSPQYASGGPTGAATASTQTATAAV